MFGYGPMMHGFGGWGYGGGFGFSIIEMVIHLVIVLAIIYFVARMWRRGMSHHYHGYEPNREAKEILARRYASGEITEEEYQRMKNAL